MELHGTYTSGHGEGSRAAVRYGVSCARCECLGELRRLSPVMPILEAGAAGIGLKCTLHGGDAPGRGLHGCGRSMGADAPTVWRAARAWMARRGGAGGRRKWRALKAGVSVRVPRRGRLRAGAPVGCGPRSGCRSRGAVAGGPQSKGCTPQRCARRHVDGSVLRALAAAMCWPSGTAGPGRPERLAGGRGRLRPPDPGCGPSRRPWSAVPTARPCDATVPRQRADRMSTYTRSGTAGAPVACATGSGYEATALSGGRLRRPGGCSPELGHGR